MKATIGIALTLAALAVAPSARASFTTAELAQIRTFVASGQVQNAPRVRAMIARTDLTPEESTQALKEAVAPIAFDDAHAMFVRDMVFGGASAPSRPLVAVAVTRALLARADVILAKFASDLDSNARAQDELARIYRFLDAEIANAGRPRGAAHDATMGIPASAYDDATKALAQHIEQHARWLKGDGQVPAPVVRVRAQLQLALVDMMNDTATRKVDAADRLGLVGARRKFFLEVGALVVDTGRADDKRVERARTLIERLPGARADAAAIVFGDDTPRLSARATVLGVKTPLEGSGNPVPWPFSDEVDPGPSDGPTLEIAYDLGLVAARRGLGNRADLRVLAERDVKSGVSEPFGKPRAEDPQVEQGIAAALQLLMTDAPRAFDLAFVRFLAQKPEAAAVMSDALGVFAAFATPGSAGLSLTLGKPKADGTLDAVTLTNVRLAPNGAVLAFTLDGHAWTFARDTGPVTSIRRDTLPLSMGFLGAARVPALEGSSWSLPGLVLARMHGSPKAGVAPGPKVRLVGGGEIGYDAIATLAPGPDVVVETDLTVTGQPGGIALRAAGNKDGFRGAALVITPWPSPRIALVLREEDGFESFLAAPQDVTEIGTLHVRLAVKGTKVEAKVGSFVLKGTIPASFARGDVAIFARKGASLECTGFTVKKQ